MLPKGKEAGSGDWPHGWQFHASRTRALYFRDRGFVTMNELASKQVSLAATSSRK